MALAINSASFPDSAQNRCAKSKTCCSFVPSKLSSNRIKIDVGVLPRIAILLAHPVKERTPKRTTNSRMENLEEFPTFLAKKEPCANKKVPSASMNASMSRRFRYLKMASGDLEEGRHVAFSKWVLLWASYR